MSYRILLVDPDETSTAVNEHTLVGAGFRTAAVSTFAEATRQISLACPDLLVTALRLKAFNGLHLLLRCREDHPELPVIVVGYPEDLTSDIGRYGARFLTKPSDPAAFLSVVSDLLQRPRDSSGERQGPRTRAEPPATLRATTWAEVAPGDSHSLRTWRWIVGSLN
jgi:DNA-binding NtrC family response regulator